jgi:hypothetical protein
MADDSPGKRTAGSQRALGLAELVNKVFANERLPSTLAAHAGYRIEMSGPDSLSTSVPAGAFHRLKLVPADAAEGKENDPGAATIVIGTADPNLTELELRTYDDLSKRHADRFNGDALPIDAAAYAALSTKIEATLEKQGVPTISSASRLELTVRPEGLPAASKPPVWFFVAVGVIVVAVGLFLALKK